MRLAVVPPALDSPSAEPEPVSQQRRRRLTAAVLVPVLLMAVAAGIRSWHVTSPNRIVWDETYYVFDADSYLGGGFGIPTPGPSFRITTEASWVHPPLGKWMIALGIGPLGDRPIGWRLPSVIFGTAGVLLLYLLALELWGSVWWAGAAGLLLALDGLHIVQSRIAMLDIFMTTFVIAGILLLVLDRTRGPRKKEPGVLDRWFGSRYRFWAGVMLGAAVATKWSALFALALAIGLCLAWRLGETRAGRGSTRREVATIALSLVAVPLLVYLVSYAQFFIEQGPNIGRFIELQKLMLLHNLHHSAVQPENSAPLTWPLLLHPIRYFPGEAGPGGAAVPSVITLGNPVLWYGFLLLLPALLVKVARRAQWQDVVVLGGYAVMYLPWLGMSRTQFNYYMVAAVPFMCLGVVAVLRELPQRVRGPAGGAFMGAATLAGVAYLPLWIGLHVPGWWLGHLPRLAAWH